MKVTTIVATISQMLVLATLAFGQTTTQAPSADAMATQQLTGIVSDSRCKGCVAPRTSPSHALETVFMKKVLVTCLSWTTGSTRWRATETSSTDLREDLPRSQGVLVEMLFW